ncbi:uncharacterized protein Bfra_000160 [Botrytis fragariae]|uniref:Uncharacterized protein n=1 Tax=Botrytis fragariae TaxID=1964551 RepID=A0A8H6EMX3_9HELO|nr:uncharacterized protein Bfra_000160 [Botrytis fragariae]KAF5877994.1 hypothetical protein Bfra_000160 [Botrytis fragariae]
MATSLTKAAEYQMGEYAFTTTGLHVPKPKDISNDVTYIIAHPQSSKSFQTTVDGLGKEGIETHSPSLSLSLRENKLSMETAEVQKYLIVGITFLNLSAAIGKKLPTVKKEVTSGQTLETATKLTWYRDSSTNRDWRATKWNKLAAKEAIRNAPLAALSTEQPRNGKSQDTTEVILEPVLSLKNSIRYHLTSHPGTSESWHFQKAFLVMEQPVEDSKDMHAPLNTALETFLDNENDDFVEDDVETMNKEMAELWPDF